MNMENLRYNIPYKHISVLYFYTGFIKKDAYTFEMIIT